MWESFYRLAFAQSNFLSRRKHVHFFFLFFPPLSPQGEVCAIGPPYAKYYNLNRYPISDIMIFLFVLHEDFKVFIQFV